MRNVTFGCLLILLALAGCLAPGGSTALDRQVVDWLSENALPGEVVAAQRPALLDGLAAQTPLALPAPAEPEELLALLTARHAGYCLAQNDLPWQAVRVQPWFVEHYRPVYQLVDPVDATTPWTLYRFAASPFDAGETVSATLRLAPAAGQEIELVAYRLASPRLTPGEPLYVTLYWRALTTVYQPLSLVVRLVDAASGQAWNETRTAAPGGLATELWNGGARLADRHALLVPADLPPGDYALEVAFFRPNGAPLADEPARVAPLYRPPEVSAALPRPDHPLTLTLDCGVELLGYDAPQRLAPGERLRVALYWRARQAVAADYKVFVHLIGPDGALAAQDDGVPLNWSYPTTRWQPGETVRDEHLLPLDAALPRGDYSLWVGWYDSQTGERVTLRDATGAVLPDGRALLQTVEVR